MRKSKTTYKIQGTEYSISGAAVGSEIERFKSLDDASKYIQERWQGIEYRDGNESFHTDYCTYRLIGFTFDDIGKTKFYDPQDVWSRYFEFNNPIPKENLS